MAATPGKDVLLPQLEKLSDTFVVVGRRVPGHDGWTALEAYTAIVEVSDDGIAAKRELPDGRLELAVKATAKIVFHAIIDTEQAAGILSGRGFAQYRSQHECGHCTQCFSGHCTQCFSGHCGDCSGGGADCCFCAARLGAGDPAVAPTFKRRAGW